MASKAITIAFALPTLALAALLTVPVANAHHGEDPGYGCNSHWSECLPCFDPYGPAPVPVVNHVADCIKDGDYDKAGLIPYAGWTTWYVLCHIIWDGPHCYAT